MKITILLFQFVFVGLFFSANQTNETSLTSESLNFTTVETEQALDDYACSYNCGVAYNLCLEGLQILREDYILCMRNGGGEECLEIANTYIEAFDQCALRYSSCLSGCRDNTGGGML